MKKIVEILIVVSLIALSASMFVWGQEQQEIKVDPLKERLASFEKKLKLDAPQVEKVGLLLKKDQERAAKEREGLKKDAMALIKKGYERNKTLMEGIEALLTDEQKKSFHRMKRMDPMERDLFELTEGLILDDGQAFGVESVLIKYYNAVWGSLPEGARERMTSPGVPMDLPDIHPRMMSGFLMFWDRMSSKKEKEIRKELKDPQKDLYQQIIKHRAQQRKKWKKAMKERRKKSK